MLFIMVSEQQMRAQEVIDENPPNCSKIREQDADMVVTDSHSARLHIPACTSGSALP